MPSSTQRTNDKTPVGTPHCLIEKFTTRVEAMEAIDPLVAQFWKRLGTVTHSPALTSVLSGTWLGHPLHPALTDLPIGAWTSAFVLDIVGGRRSRRAAQTLVGLGVLTAVPTALTGLSDWADTAGPTRRVGVVHGLANAAGMTLYGLSWMARRAGQQRRGALLGMIGALSATAGATLGGHLTFRLGVGVDVNAGDPSAADWVDSDAGATLPKDAGRYLEAGFQKVLALNENANWHGLSARCTHRGGPLQDGEYSNGCVRCPWHGARFRLSDGLVVDGPATAPQPQYEVRETSGGFSFRRTIV
jgi:nitrite reductase/ring-hydroxylating ferredoxin subunit/uncharacterized membrane protein